jgi:glycosyltransferase involved in cell wall biosynthesis
MEKLTLLIPANKEAESLPIFLKELENYRYKKLIVLQSEDQETIDSIASFKDIEICVQKNRGYGSALKEGIDKIETEFFCIINADGSMNPKYLEEMLSLCENKDLVFASRYLTGGGSDDDDVITLVGNKIFSFIGNTFFKLNLSDILYTYILGKTQSAKKLSLKHSDFRICVEIPILAKLNNYYYDSTPSMERKRIGGKKKVNAIKDGFLILTAMINLFFKKKD